jgi:hypothetical protein
MDFANQLINETDKTKVKLLELRNEELLTEYTNTEEK